MPLPEDLDFDAATAIRPAAQDGLFDVAIHPLWAVGDKPNGGYLLALMARCALAVGQEVEGRWSVVSSSVTYLRPPEAGPGRVRATVLRTGRTAAHVRAVLLQGDTELVDAVFVLGILQSTPSVRYDANPDFGAPDPDQCLRLPPQIPGGVRIGIMDVLDLRMDPATIPFREAPAAAGTPAELRAWSRFADGREPDALSLLFSVDAIPPATLMIGSTGWVPTLQMSAYVRAVPAPGWLGIRFTANVVADGMVDETCIVWDSRGYVVAQSTQLARLRFPDDVG